MFSFSHNLILINDFGLKSNYEPHFQNVYQEQKIWYDSEYLLNLKSKYMSTYTDAELQTMMNGPMMVGMAISMVDLGIISSMIEATALTKEILNAAKKYPNNSIITSTFAEEVIKSGRVKPQKPEVTAEEITSGAFLDKALAAVNQGINVVEGKATPEEIQEYKQFIYECGEVVAEAAGSGLFGSGTKVSPKETAALERLKIALGL